MPSVSRSLLVFIGVFALGAGVSARAEISPRNCDVPASLSRFEFRVMKEPCPAFAEIEKVLLPALVRFENEIGPTTGKFKITIAGAGARTGYDPDSDTIQFPNLKHIRNRGLDSPDVIAHEFFHQLTCRRYPVFCRLAQKEVGDAAAISEGSADYFSYLLHPDRCFGENYKVESECLRFYASDYDYHLVAGAHEKASVLSQYFIRSKFKLSALGNFFSKESALIGDLVRKRDRKHFVRKGKEDAISVTAEGLGSRRGGQVFVVSKMEPGLLLIRLSEEMRKRHPDAQLNFVRDIEAKSGTNFQIKTSTITGVLHLEILSQPSSEIRDSEKYFILVEENGKTVGRRRIFLQVGQ